MLINLGLYYDNLTDGGLITTVNWSWHLNIWS